MPKGRMINRKISKDHKLAAVSPIAALLYSWMIPHGDCEGRLLAKTGWIKWEIVPLLNYFSLKKIESCIFELEKIGLILIYGNNREYIELIGFSKNQSINKEREAPSEIPAPEQLLSKSGVTPLEVKAKAKEEVKDKAKEKYEILIKPKSKKFMVAWDAFISERKKKKKEPSFHAMCLLLTELENELAPNNEDKQIKIINKSITNGWTGLFEIKDNRGGYAGKHQGNSKIDGETNKFDGIGTTIKTD